MTTKPQYLSHHITPERLRPQFRRLLGSQINFPHFLFLATQLPARVLIQSLASVHAHSSRNQLENASQFNKKLVLGEQNFVRILSSYAILAHNGQANETLNGEKVHEPIKHRKRPQ